MKWSSTLTMLALAAAGSAAPATPPTENAITVYRLKVKAKYVS